MKHETPSEEIRELAALYSLGALTQHEANSFETHMREGCTVCSAEYHRFKHIAAEIGLGANEAKAPEYLRELVLMRIERQKPVQPPEKEQAPVEEKEKPAQEDTGTVTPKSPAPAPKPLLTQTSNGRRSSIFPWIMAVIFAVVAGLTIFAYRNQQSDYDILKEEKASLQTEIEDTQALLDIQKNRRGELEQIISTVSKPETRILHLAGLAPAPESSGAILWDVVLNKCLIFGHMPPAPQGKAYQLWFLTSSAKIPSGTMRPDPSGRIYEWFTIPENISSLTMVITLEPESGSQIPTPPYFAIGRND